MNKIDTKSPQEYFLEQIKLESKKLKIKLNADVEFYLVNLLCDFIDPSKVYNIINEEQNLFNTPLVFLIKKAYETSSIEYQINIFKLLGDTCLYISGYFQDFFNRKTFDIEYYITMGTYAYSKVSHLLQSTDKSNNKSAVFNELAHNFIRYVDLLGQIADNANQTNNKDILALYERWTKTNSERLRKILNELGISPVKVPYKKAQ